MKEDRTETATPGGDDGAQLHDEQIIIRDKLLSILSHDFRSFLSSLSGLLSRLLHSDSENLTDRQRMILETLTRSAADKTALIESVSQISRMIRGLTKMEKVPVGAVSMMKECAAEHAAAAAAKDIELTVEEREPAAMIEADPGKLGGALGRVIKNAVWYTNPGGRVRLYVEEMGGKVAIVIQDDGVGIERERIADVLKPSTTGRTYGTNEEKGAGLGLCVARETVERNGGAFAIESGKGEGTRVRFIFEKI